MTLALYCTLGACDKCGGKRCSCTCHGGRTPPGVAMTRSDMTPARVTAKPTIEESSVHKCRFCAHTSPNAQGRAAHERWCIGNPDGRRAAAKRATSSRAAAPVVVDPPPSSDVAIAVEGELTVTIKGPAARILELLRAIDT